MLCVSCTVLLSRQEYSNCYNGNSSSSVARHTRELCATESRVHNGTSYPLLSLDHDWTFSHIQWKSLRFVTMTDFTGQILCWTLSKGYLIYKTSLALMPIIQNILSALLLRTNKKYVSVMMTDQLIMRVQATSQMSYIWVIQTKPAGMFRLDKGIMATVVLWFQQQPRELWRGPICWCVNGMPGSMLLGIIFNGVYSFTQKNPWPVSLKLTHHAHLRQWSVSIIILE